MKKEIIDNATLYLGDCLEILPTLEKVDAVITDPPYGTTACKWDSIIPLEPMWTQLERVIKKNGAIVMTASQPFTTTLISSNMKMFKYEWIWEKTMPTGMAQSSYMPMKYHENICLFLKNGKPVFNKQMADRSESGKVRAKTPIQGNSHKSNHVQVGKQEAKQYDKDKVNPKTVLKFGSVPNSNGKLHPTQKPVDLMEYLIKTYTNEGETVLDFAMGSGTTGVACMNLGRKFIGIEIEEKYFNIACERIEQSQKQGRLFA